MENFVFGMVFSCIVLFFVIMFLFHRGTITRGKILKFRRRLINVLKDHGIENDLNDEILYVKKKGLNIRCQFGYGNDGAVDVVIDSLFNIDDFKIDWIGELFIERKINNHLPAGCYAQFIEKKRISISYLTSVRQTDTLMKEMDSYVTYVNDAINNLYENKQILEENFREKNEQQSIRKIGF